MKPHASAFHVCTGKLRPEISLFELNYLDNNNDNNNSNSYNNNSLFELNYLDELCIPPTSHEKLAEHVITR